MSFRSIVRDVRDGFGSLSRRSFEVRLSGHLRGKSQGSVHELHSQNLVVVQSCWARLPPELLRDVISRLEASETTWPARKHVVACAAVCKSWREMCKEIVKSPQFCGKLTFPISLKQPGPRDGVIQCFIKRDKATLTYHLFLCLSPALLVENGKFLLSAKRNRRTTYTEYIISMDADTISRSSSSYIGKLRMWMRGMVLPCFEALARSKKVSSPVSPWILFSCSYCSEFSKKKGKLAPLQERRMVDRVRLRAKGGEGGNGCSSLRRSRHDRRGKPDGGNGGRGGDVILECSSAIWDFSNLQHHLNAKRGGHGVSKNKIGSRGADKVAQVPVGTVIHLVWGELPSTVENNVAGLELKPWEIPGTIETNLPSFDQNINTDRASDSLEKKEFDSSPYDSKRCSMKSINAELVIPDSSIEFVGQSSQTDGIRSQIPEESTSCSEESKSGGEEMQSEYDEMSEAEPEEEILQYSVAELTVPGQRIVIAKGGEGGLGNASTGKVSRSHKIVTSDLENLGDETTGLPGSETFIVLELKSIADVGLVGIPNAGKSTLLGAISRAKPAIGHYAFTTLRPNVGNLNYDDYFSVTVADIPGLIKGAHANRGLGHAFLRHIERTRVLAYVVDLSAGLDGRKGIPPWEQLRDLVLELELHQSGLSDRPSLIVANKIDEEGANDVYEELKRRVQTVPIFPVCAVLEEGVSELKSGLRSLVDGVENTRLKLSGIILD